MKLARWGLALEFAKLGGRTTDGVTSHAFVADSNAPICMPFREGSVELIEPAGWDCEACTALLNKVWLSVTSFEKRLLWALTQSYGRNILLHGIATCSFDVHAHALEALRKALPSGTPVQIVHSGSVAAEKLARELRARARAKKVGAPGGPQVVEYVYLHEKVWASLASSEYTWRTKQAKILRKTAKLVFVEHVRDSYTTADGVLVLKTFTLDRRTLELKGEHRGWTTNPRPPSASSSSVPGWAQVLDVPATCSRAELRRAYHRSVASAHPDRGGSSERFREVQQAYATAQTVMGGEP